MVRFGDILKALVNCFFHILTLHADFISSNTLNILEKASLLKIGSKL
jgi:hypothetical protein